MMNDRAREIGLTKSNFTNVDGLPDPKMRVTPRELAVMARYIVLNYPDYYKWFGEREFTWNKIRQLNRNPLLGAIEGADGMKTGFTNEAGYNLVGSAVQNGVRLIVVVTGLKNPKDRADDAKKLLDYGFKNFRLPRAVRRGPDRGRSQGLWRRAGQRSGGRQGRGQAHGAARRQRQDRRQDGLHRTGPGAGAGRQAIGNLQVWRGDAKFWRCRCRRPKASRQARSRDVPSMPRRNL
jgi:D-alanyl-D-alanine carboxypeptidase (penicillin-binding protein 5/6)